MRFLILIILVVSFYFSSGQNIAERNSELIHINSDGIDRKALVVHPKETSQEGSPLVFVFHGRGGQIEVISKRMAIHKFFPEAVVVYPQGEWGQGRNLEGFGWIMPSLEDEGIDIRFFDKLYEEMCSKYNIDKDRVYSMGHSNGGGMTLALWATRADKFAAFAPSAASNFIFFRTFDMVPKPIFYMARQDDEQVKFPGIKICLRRMLRINNCQGSVEEGNYIVKYSSEDGNDVWTSFLPEGGHKMQPSAYGKVVEFFRSHPRKR